jgi:hypothetical protein
MSLYNLIRDRAGTKMLRQAESINMYDQVSDYLGDSHIDVAIDIFKTFETNYSLSPETQMSAIWLHEIQKIDSKELQELPWVYVYMLQALSGHDPESAKILKEQLAASPAAAWRIPLPEEVEPVDAFKHVYEEWMSNNQWIHSFSAWAVYRESRL